MVMKWQTFKKNCKARNKSGRCSIKCHYRYNDYCERVDCPAQKDGDWSIDNLALRTDGKKYIHEATGQGNGI